MNSIPSTPKPSPEPVRIRVVAVDNGATDSSEQIRKLAENVLAQAYLDSLTEVAS